LRISAIFGQPGNVMFLLFYDIIAKVIAAQRFLALELLALGRKCHEMCGYVTFCEIFDVRYASDSDRILRCSEMTRSANKLHHACSSK
jgi:hypothetical protein